MDTLIIRAIASFLAGIEPDSGRRQKYIGTFKAPDTTHKRLPAPVEGMLHVSLFSYQIVIKIIRYTYINLSSLGNIPKRSFL